jgi:predicted DNA-binding transcriptional regulator YafY
VEGYSAMNADAFARRFYADRSELDSLGIALTVERPVDGVAEQENYSLRPENFHLPAIAFSDAELAALQTALSLLDGEFAYAEPLRLALQQVSWGRPSPLAEEDEAPIDVKLSGAGGGRELSQRLAKIETAISRRKTVEFSYYSLQRDEVSDRKVDPYHLVFREGQFYLIGHSHERGEVRVFRLSRIEGFDPATAAAVLHIILSHHGSLEHGSPIVPCTREATLVHFCDNLGGRLGSFDRLEKELPDGSRWSAYDRALGGGAFFAERVAA